ncbi:xylulokinase [Alginatibacterium sediminis]|uniref:Xylulose kinase n=1 Tax=Alginatibacterium sediminis TaxID=2164068 RepID=A0A420EHE1_9ALTE|nr:xylulokinase [Alginatibacterium sediminis]RKF20080.1 xylulokinase [Alginatibacterium sediminis]
MYIGIDCGTQGTKAIVWDPKRGVLGRSYHSYGIIQDGSGKQEQHPHWWFDATRAAISAALADSKVDGLDIKALSISGQQHGLVVLDKHSKVIRPAKLWCDTQTTDALTRFEQQLLPNRFVDLIGIQVPVAFTIAKLAWLKENEPTNFNQISKILLPHDYLNYMFTGQYKCEAGDASGTGYFDTRSKHWNTEVLKVLGLPSSCELPELIESHQAHGQIKPTLAASLGLNPKLIIGSGGGDNMMAAIGSANVVPGMLTLSLGTSGTAYTFSNEQVSSANFPDINAFCSSNNAYLPLISTMNVTSATSKMNQLLDSSLTTFETNLRTTPIGSKGLVVFPYFIGARLPNLPKANGSIMGINDQNLNSACLQRATVEAICFNLWHGIQLLIKSGLCISRATVIGGGANSAAWRQMVADICNLEVVSPLETELGALGAAIQACWCSRLLQSEQVSLQDLCEQAVQLDPSKNAKPIHENVEMYKGLYQQYQEMLHKHYLVNED